MSNTGTNAEDDPQNATNNPYNRLRNTTGNVQTNTLKTRLYAILTPLKGLTIQGSYTYDYYDKFKESNPNFVPSILKKRSLPSCRGKRKR